MDPNDVVAMVLELVQATAEEQWGDWTVHTTATPTRVAAAANWDATTVMASLRVVEKFKEDHRLRDEEIPRTGDWNEERWQGWGYMARLNEVQNALRAALGSCLDARRPD